MLSRRALRTVFMRDTTSLLYRENSIHARDGDLLHRSSSRPANFHRIDQSRVAQTKVHARIVGRREAAAAQYVTTLGCFSCSHKNSGAHGIAWLARTAYKLKLDPVVLIAIHITQEGWSGVKIVHNDVYLAVVEEVAKSGAPRRRHHREPASLHRRNEREFATTGISQQQRSLGEAGPPVVIVYLFVDVTAGDENVLPAVVVVVDEAIAPAKKWDRIFGDSSFIARIDEVQVAIVSVQHFVVVRKVSVQNIQAANIPVVAHRDSHRRRFPPIVIDRISGLEAEVLEGAIALVPVEIVRRRIVRHQELGFPIVIQVNEQRRQAVISRGVGYPGLLADIGEFSIAIIVEKMVVLASESARPAEHTRAPILTIVRDDGV